MKNRIDSLQWLRAIASFWVLFTHVFQRLGLQPFGYTFSGQWGVDIFFILSGFIIFYTTKDGTDWLKFVKKRVFRIFPLYLFCLFVYYSFYHATECITLSLLQWTQNILMMPFSDSIGFHSLLVGQAWSTCYELYFYYLLALLLLLHIRKKWLILFLIALYAIGLLIGSIDALTQIGFVKYVLSLISSRHIMMFCIGIGVAMCYTKNPLSSINRSQHSLRFCLFFVVVTYILLCLLRYNFLLSIVLSTTAFVICLLSQPILQDTGWVNRFMTYLGDISFSVYLVHSVIIRLFMNEGIETLLLLLPLTLITTIVIASFTYKFIEKPFINLAKR